MDRKEKVKTIGKHLGIKPKYLGVPSFSYQVGEFIVGREGKIKNGTGEEVELEEILNPAEETATTVEIAIPLEGYNENTLKNLVNMIYSRQVLIKKSFQLDKDILETEIIEKLNKIDSLEEFKSTLESENIRIENENIIFTIKTDLARSATLFFGLLNEKSKELKYASKKPVNTDNEKYTFRAWLMRLGMIGDEYKEARKELLKNLSGNSAFRKPGESDEA
ncbi:virulence-related protein [Senegalia sp. (in: firmicutes)]|uniref:virulence-related protein n=1 Tax=Senegalia sp. (in: firmicutes) TaxID=1924098 RepID=UPI003F964F60